MFNLPWYAWLNVFALPCLWLYLMLDFALQGKPKWFRQYTTVSLIACMLSLFLYWNPSLNALFSPLQLGLVALIVPLVIWSLGISCLQLLASPVRWWTRDAEEGEASLASTQSGVHFNLDDDDIDLDGGAVEAVDDVQRGKAIAGLFSKNATLDDSLGNIMTLLGAQQDDSSPGVPVSLLLAQVFCMSLILLPPLVLSLRLIQ